MPNHREELHADIQQLIEDYNKLQFWQRWIYPAKLKQAITSNAPQNFIIYQSFVDNVWFFQRWFIRCLTTFSNSEFMKLCTDLRAHLFTKDLNTAIGQANFNAVVGHTEPWGGLAALEFLYTAGLLIGEAGQANFNAVVGHATPRYVDYALLSLSTAGLLTGEAGQTNFNTVVGHANLKRLSPALNYLGRGNLLVGEAGQAYFNALVGRGAVCAFSPYIAGLLVSEAGQTPYYSEAKFAVRALNLLNAAGLLEGEAGRANFSAVVEHEKLPQVTVALGLLSTAGLLEGEAGQANFTALIQHTQILFYASHHELSIWSHIPQITREQFTAIIEICIRHAATTPDGRRVFRTYVYEEILQWGRRRDAVRDAGLLSNWQSTHTASVHASVSESAKKLWSHYNEQISDGKLHAKIIEISTAINALPSLSTAPDDHRSAAKRCLNRMNARGDLDFIDRTSNITTKQLLALVWIAVHDAKRRCSCASEEDGITALIKGLYEIQRGYNLSSTQVDNGETDNPICQSGTFNKLVESLVSIHPDAEIKMITKKVAELRLQAVVKEQFIAHCKGLPKPNTQEERGQRSVYIESITSEDGMKPEIWAAIRPTVLEVMFTEFQALYLSSVDPLFIGLIDAGEAVVMTKAELQETGILSKTDVMPSSGNSQAFFPPHSANAGVLAGAAHSPGTR